MNNETNKPTSITVKQLNLYVKSLLEGNSHLSHCYVTGEVSNLKTHYSSGHIYFTLKDEFASIKCVMFKSFAFRGGSALKEGAKLNCFGRVSLYERDGSYQFYVEGVYEEGLGDAARRLAELKKKLGEEGLFDPSNKRPIPSFPKKIAVVTSGSGAALQDIINVVTRRCPLCEIVLFSTSVQGARAVAEMLTALDKLYSFDDIETVIIGRGGGSSEDLSAYNDELLARKLYESPFPVISAVGHETDLCICDLVADLRAPTPSAAAELAVPDCHAVLSNIKKTVERIGNNCLRRIELSDARLLAVRNLSVFSHPATLVEPYYITIDKLNDRISHSIQSKIDNDKNNFLNVISRINAMNPLAVLSRGYAAISKDERYVTSSGELSSGDSISIKFCDGTVDCSVN